MKVITIIEPKEEILFPLFVESEDKKSRQLILDHKKYLIFSEYGSSRLNITRLNGNDLIRHLNSNKLSLVPCNIKFKYRPAGYYDELNELWIEANCNLTEDWRQTTKCYINISDPTKGICVDPIVPIKHHPLKYGTMLEISNTEETIRRSSWLFDIK